MIVFYMSYTRPCNKCGERISLRQMPAGQWVAFDVLTEETHVCGVKNKPHVSVKLKGKKKAKIKEDDEDFGIKIDDIDEDFNEETFEKNEDELEEVKTYDSVSGIHKCIDNAIKEKKRIFIEYNSDYNQEFTEREISPIKKFKEKDRTYLQAYCHKRNAERIFTTRSIASASEVNKQRTKIKLGRPNLKIIKKLDNEYSSDEYVEKKVVKKRDTTEVYETPTKRKFDLREEIEGMIQLIVTISIIGGLIYVFFFN